MLVKQSYEIKNALERGEQLALEILWTGTLAIPFGTIPAGTELRAHLGVFIEFREGRIVSQRNYDCYEPFQIG